LLTKTAVRDMLYEKKILGKGPVRGVILDNGESVSADVVIVAEGVNAALTKKAGLSGRIGADLLSLWVREVISLPAEKYRHQVSPWRFWRYLLYVNGVIFLSILGRLKTPVFKAEGIPKVDEKAYRLNVWGLVKSERMFTLQEILEMPKTSLNARLTSVSGWSVRANWEGVLWQDFMSYVDLMPGAIHARFTSIGGYDTSMPLAVLNERVMLVYAVEGEPLEKEYGWPLRLLVPHLWGYKSCKWLADIQFTDSEQGGFWEDRGYTRSGQIEPGLTLDINTRTERPIKGGGEVTEF